LPKKRLPPFQLSTEFPLQIKTEKCSLMSAPSW